MACFQIFPSRNIFKPIVRKLRRDERASALLEASLSLPLLLLLASGLIDLGFTYEYTNVATVAVRHGARSAAAAAYDDPNVCVQDYVQDSNCDSLPAQNNIADLAVISSCQYLQQYYNVAAWNISAQTTNHVEGGAAIKLIRVEATSDLGLSCKFCFKRLLSSKPIHEVAVFALEKRCTN